MRALLAFLSLISPFALTISHAERYNSAPVSARAHIIFVGDIMLGRFVGASMQAHGQGSPFQDITPFLRGADLAVANLEGPLVPPSAGSLPLPSADQPLLTGSSLSAPALHNAGIDLVSLANNHSLDAGRAGLNSTVVALTHAGVGAFGTGAAGAQLPLIRQVGSLRVAFLAYTAIPPNMSHSLQPGVALLDTGSSSEAALQRDVTRAHNGADVVVIFMHWGTEFSSRPDPTQRSIARMAADAGANMVVGAHPHVAQGMETLARPDGGTTLVAYSLGNALFDQSLRADTREGLALDCVTSSSGIESARLVPIETARTASGYTMRLSTGPDAEETIARATAGLPSVTAPWQTLTTVSSTPTTALAYRRLGSADVVSTVDLGTGSPVTAQLRNGTLALTAVGTGSATRTLWRSNPGWRVTGYTVGDANGDGKPDLVYTLWKRSLIWQRPPGGGMSVQMEGGPLLPHIYINSWRDGELLPLWHGSPRPAPALAVAVAKIDGEQILAVLESSSPTVEQSPGTLRLWRWTGGFGFELAAQVPGSYSQLWSDSGTLLFR
ncbi:MAG: CapA family protein [Chloroflexota bacterium]|nr:CapA family protein [Chloroflexota bacterium]